LQDEVVGRIVTALVEALPSTSLPPKRRAPNIAAYDLFVRGRAMTLLTLPDPKNSARPLLEKAIELDPDFADAHAWLAMNLAFQWIDAGQIDERDKILAEAERAVSLDPDNADGYFVRGYALTYNGNLPAGREQFELALKSNPNHADAWLFLADLEVFEGDPDAALRSVDMAFQLNPYPHAAYYWLRGFALYAARRYEDAVATLQHKSCREAGAQRILAAALAQLGRHDEAREAVLRFLKTVPQFRTESWAKTQPFRKADDLQHFIDGYIKAGLPA
jgi:adenylate cyclase